MTGLRSVLRRLLPGRSSRFLRRSARRFFPPTGRIDTDDAAARRFWRGAVSVWGAFVSTGWAPAAGYAELARAHLFLDDLAAAETAVCGGLHRYPAHSGLTRRGAEAATRRDDWPTAVERWRSLVDRDGGNASPDTVARFVRALRHAGRLAEARTVLGEALGRHPASMKLLCERAFCGNSPARAHDTTFDVSATPVEIVVCVYNALDDAGNCLRSIRANTTTPYRLTIVDDASTKEVASFLDDFVQGRLECRVLRNAENLGYTRSANIGLRQARGDWVVLLNSDTVVTPGWIEGLLECASSGPKVAAIGPLSNTANLQSVPRMRDRSGDFAFNRLPPGMTPDDAAAIVREASERAFPRVPLLNGFCTMLARRALDEVGYLDEISFPKGYGEENDLCLRLVSAGYDLAIADHVYVHHAKSASFGNRKREALIDRSIRQNETKWPGYSYAYAAEGVELIRSLADLRARLDERL